MRICGIGMTLLGEFLKSNWMSRLTNNTGMLRVQSMYKPLSNNSNIIQYKVLWELKLHLKIKIFYVVCKWYVHRGVVLTKMKLLNTFFMDCHFAKFLCRMVHFCFGLTPPHSVSHIFGSWLHGVDVKLKNNY